MSSSSAGQLSAGPDDASSSKVNGAQEQQQQQPPTPPPPPAATNSPSTHQDVPAQSKDTEGNSNAEEKSSHATTIASPADAPISQQESDSAPPATPSKPQPAPTPLEKSEQTPVPTTSHINEEAPVTPIRKEETNHGPNPTEIPNTPQPALNPQPMDFAPESHPDPEGFNAQQPQLEPLPAAYEANGDLVPVANGGTAMNQLMGGMDWGHPPNMAPSTPLPSMQQTAAQMLRYMAQGHMAQSMVHSSPHHGIVTPAQVQLPPPMPEGHDAMDLDNMQDAQPNSYLESFARIEFLDSVFQMTTYAVLIGRDQRAMLQARRDERDALEHQRRVESAEAAGMPIPPPPSERKRRFSKSYVSEEGGMLGPESVDSENDRPTRRRKTSHGDSAQNDKDEVENTISNRQYISHTPGAAAVDLAALQPDPDYVPFIAIHSPGPDIAKKTRAISREHLRIEFNKKTHVFEAHPLHTNGFFCEDEFIKRRTVVLRCGDRLQIKDVPFTFMINGVAIGKTGAEDVQEEPTKARKQGGKEMSFDFEQSVTNEHMQSTSDSDDDLSPPPESDEDIAPEEDAEEVEEENEDENEEDDNEEFDKTAGDETMQDLPPQLPGDIPLPEMPAIPKKRGPGRPPKNGVMSKREQRQIKKMEEEIIKQSAPQPAPQEPPVKRKVGRPRKHPLPENAGDQPEKRKYKPRKPKNEDGEEGSDAERKAKEKKDKKVRSKSPPLHLNREDYTVEDLQKPPKNYSMLIDEALTGNPDGLTLKQIYKRICLRYPHFYFNVETKGWESSVRHNLIGNKAFQKDEERGVWIRLPGVDLDASKKTRKGNTPERELAGQPYGAYGYPYNAQVQNIPGGVPGYPPNHLPPNYQMPNQNAQQPMQPVQPYGSRPAAPAQPIQAQAQAQPLPGQVQGNPQPAGVAHGLPPAPARPQAGAPPAAAFGSQQAPRGVPQAGPAIKTEEGTAAAPSNNAAQQPHMAAAAARPMYHPPGVQQPNRPSQNAAQIPPQHQPSPQQPMGQPMRPAAASPPAPAVVAPIDPVLLNAVVNLKNGLISNLKKANNPYADTIVYSAINRCAGLKKEATDGNDNMERICMKGIQQVINGYRAKNRSPTPGSSTPETALIDPSVVRTLVGFKDVSCNTLKTSLGLAQAEAVTLSAIDRVLGLADETLVNDEKFVSIEEKLIKTARHLLDTLNQRRAQSTEVGK